MSLLLVDSTYWHKKHFYLEFFDRIDKFAVRVVGHDRLL